ncbi:MAG: DUF928 domain-containing protein [Leptolyngbya sp. RL_3_1]|nr:DUF928 domain-containing protein [Leptolyngbya sp. RL_3_1]
MRDGYEIPPCASIQIGNTTEPTLVQFALKNEHGTEELVNATFEISGEAGVIGFQPITLSQELNAGESYYWQMTVRCDVDVPERNPIIDGWITRAEQPDGWQGRGFERAVTFLEAGIWQDAVTLLAQARLYASDATAAAIADEDWQVILEGVGLGDFANEPIVAIIQQ